MADTAKTSAKVFILTGEWQDIRGKNQLRFVGTSDEMGIVEMNFTNNPVFFINNSSVITNLSAPYSRKEVDLKNFEENKVDALYFNNQRDLKTASEELDGMGVKTFESDIDPSRRFLMERFINAQVQVEGTFSKKKNLVSFTNPKIEPCEFTPKLLNRFNRY